MAGRETRASSITPILAAIGLLAAVAIGSVWTATAIVDGAVTATVVRFAASVAAGFYYLVMYRIARGRPVFAG